MQLTNNFLVMYPSNHTYLAPTAAATQSTIDFFVSNSSFQLDNIERIDELFSDHWGITATIGSTTDQSTAPRLDYKRANWAAFQFAITQERNQIPQPTTKSEIDTANSRRRYTRYAT